MSNGNNNNNNGNYNDLFPIAPQEELITSPNMGSAGTTTLPQGSPTNIAEVVNVDPFSFSNIGQIDDRFITPQTFQNTSCKDYLLTEFGNYDSDFSFEPSFLKNKLDRNPAVADKLRAKTGNFWTNYSITANGIKKDAFSYFRKVFGGYVPVSIMFDPFNQGVTRTEESLFFSTQETIALKADQYSFMTEPVFNPGSKSGNVAVIQPEFSSEMYGAFLKGEQFEDETYDPMVQLNQEYTDHSCFINSFYKLKEANQMASVTPICYADIHDQYNSYIEPYENLLEQDNVSEVTLPNLYAFYLMSEDNASKDFENLITLNNDSVVKETLGKKAKGEYFIKYSMAYNADELGNLRAKYKNLIIPYGDIKSNVLYNENKNLFPMTVNIDFRTDSRTEFAELLKESQLSTTFLKYIVDLLDSPNDVMDLLDVFEYGTERSQRNAIRKFDLTAFINRIREENFFEELNSDNAVFLGMLNEEPKIDNTSDFSMILSLLSAVFYAKINESVNKHFRTFRELLAGKPAYSETVMYKICKYRGDGTGEPLQRIFLPNSNEIDVHNYIDTQVKYGEVYTYKIFGYEMVIGNKYEYINLQHDHNSQDMAFVQVKQSPSVQLLETELFTRVLAVVDNPPMAPEIDIVPFKGVNNKMRHLLNRSIGKVVAHPIIIEPGEKEKFDNYKILKDIEPDEPIVFKSDDIPSYFEVYRTSERPEKYEDFSGKRITRVRTDVNLETIQKAASATYDDNIEANQKYYYMFRSIDVHNNISLPTEVFEVEIIDDEGVVYPRIKAIEIKDINNNVASKSFKRFLKIKPATSQLFFNDELLEGLESAKDASNVKLGVADESVWGKKFKLRLTSKQTGRKIDINFEFGHNHKPE
jgi:hypothetical protein